MSAAVATRPDAGFSLWARDPQGTWHHFGNGSQQELELKARGLKALFTNKRWKVVPGTDPPH